MRTNNQSVEHARLEARVTPEQKELIQHAADLEGRSLTDYLVTSATLAARQTIELHEVIRLTVRGSEAFFATIETPPTPGPRLRAAAQRYRDFTGS